MDEKKYRFWLNFRRPFRNVVLAFAFVFPVSMVLTSCKIGDLIEDSRISDPGLSLDEKVVLGLRTALNVGIDSSSAIASKANGYFAHKVIKILLPPEVKDALQAADSLKELAEPFLGQLRSPGMQKLINTVVPEKSTQYEAFSANRDLSLSLLSDIAGLRGISDSLIKYMNRAAENSASRSGPIFKDAIFAMSISDGLALLNNADSTAATSYLNGKTFNPLVVAYTPVVDSTLALLPLTRYWGTFRTTYNSILNNYAKLLSFQSEWNNYPVVATFSLLQVNKLKPVPYKPISTESLGAWTTDKALGGLFFLVGVEERKIRHDPLAYIQGLTRDISSILREVFVDIMKMPN